MKPFLHKFSGLSTPLSADFFARDALVAAPEMVGLLLCRRLPGGEIKKLRIDETECYRGEEDKACHASKGRTKRTAILYGQSGIAYVYLCYGMHWLLNAVTGPENSPQAVLIRSAEGYNGPAKLTKALQIDGMFNGQPLIGGDIWFEDDGARPEITAAPRVGIAYAGEEWAAKPWRFIAKR